MKAAGVREAMNAFKNLNGWDLVKNCSVDDNLTSEVMWWAGRMGEEFRGSEISEMIFGDRGNNHVLAVSMRLKLLKEAGKVRCLRGCIYTTEGIEPVVKLCGQTTLDAFT